jgi:hypothetical protein
VSLLRERSRWMCDCGGRRIGGSTSVAWSVGPSSAALTVLPLAIRSISEDSQRCCESTTPLSPLRPLEGGPAGGGGVSPNCSGGGGGVGRPPEVESRFESLRSAFAASALAASASRSARSMAVSSVDSERLHAGRVGVATRPSVGGGDRLLGEA